MSVINTNIMSLNAQRHLGTSQSSMQTSMERLSSGLRVNSAKDDAAGLAIGKKMGAEVASLNQAIRNANDGISMIQTTEGGLEEVHVMLERMKELATQAASDTLGNDQKDLVQKEFSQLIGEIGAVATRTTFNGNSMLASEDTTVSIQIGTTAGDTLDITSIDATATGLGVDGLSVASDGDASAALTAINTAIDTVSENRATLGASQNRLEHVVANLQVKSENLSAAKSRIMDADFAAETANLTRAQVLQQAGTAMLAQANQAPQNVLSLLR